MFTYVIDIDGDKIQCIKCCELSTVIITVHGNRCLYNLDCLVRVILQELI